MKVLIQQLETELFLGEDGAWLKDRAHAREFRNSADAIVHCVKERLKDVRVAMIFGDPAMDVYYYPFQNQKIREETKALRGEAEALKAKKKPLVEQIQANVADLARQAQQLPLRRKKKRERPPEED